MVDMGLGSWGRFCCGTIVVGHYQFEFALGVPTLEALTHIVAQEKRRKRRPAH